MAGIDDMIRDLFRRQHQGELMPGHRPGVAVTVKKRSAGSYNPATGSLGGVTTSTVSATALVRNYTLEEVAASGALVLQGDIELTLLSSEVSDLSNRDLVSLGGSDWRVIHAEPRYVGGSIFDWLVQARRAG